MITIVSGLPRSGTSMMMKMLDNGGIPPMIDNIRKADEDNPRGYYEFEPVKQIKEDSSWLPEVEGKAVKMVSRLLLDLPPGYQYKIVFMRRKLSEILASQAVMLERSGKSFQADVEQMSSLFEKHLDQVQTWLSQQPHIDTLYQDFNQIIADPEPAITSLNDFLGGCLDIDAMRQVVEPKLYRQRG